MGIHTKLLPPHLPPFFLSHACESLPCSISGEGGGGKRQINKLSFQSLYSRRELDEEAAGMGGRFRRGGPAASN